MEILGSSPSPYAIPWGCGIVVPINWHNTEIFSYKRHHEGRGWGYMSIFTHFYLPSLTTCDDTTGPTYGTINKTYMVWDKQYRVGDGFYKKMFR